jgi:hypothetical protein
MCYYGGIRRSRLPCLLDQPSYGTCWSTWNTLWLRLSSTPSLSSSASSSYGFIRHRYWTGTGFVFLIVSSDHSGQDWGFYFHIFSELNFFFVAENCLMPTKHLWPRAASFVEESNIDAVCLGWGSSSHSERTFFLRYHPGLGPLWYSCASRRISSSAQPACSVRSLIDVCNLPLILLYSRIWSFVSRYYFFPIVCPGCVILFPLKLYWIWGCVLSVWQVVGALWIVSKLGSWLHSLTLVWIGTSHWCFLFALLVMHRILLQLQQFFLSFFGSDFQYIFPYSYYSRHLYMNLSFPTCWICFIYMWNHAWGLNNSEFFLYSYSLKLVYVTWFSRSLLHFDIHSPMNSLILLMD